MTHGMTDSPEYNTWQDMKDRCCNPNSPQSKYYGERGIKVSPEWLNSFETFLRDMGPRPSVGYSIERIDNNGDYCKENCKWASNFEQNRNKRSNVWITLDGETRCLTDWSKIYGVPRDSIRHRLKRGWSVRDALTAPPMPFGQRNASRR